MMNLTINPNYTEPAQPGTHKTQKTIYAGAKNPQETDSLGNRIAAAQKKSMKKILDQFKIDSATDKNLKDRTAHMEELSQQIVDNLKEIKEIDESIASYKEQFGITEETAPEDYPEEYKQIVSDLETKKAMCQHELDPTNRDNLYRQKQYESAMIQGIKQERLKYHDMVDTQKIAEEIMDDALKQAVKDITEEARENMDNTFEATKEEAAKRKSEEEKREEELIASETDKEKTRVELKKYIEEQHIIDEDAIGLMVDKQM
ncbi:MAG: hypothetical protein J1F02_06365 [Lachnospiraceae bacterium]|nr:hypothetical protein [Lachnospiraceae bacterium]